MSSPEELRRLLGENPLESRERPLEGKVALITGSSRDIGARIAVAMAQQGVVIIGNYREKESRATGVDLGIRSKGGRIESVQADITVPEQRERLGLVLKESFGGNLDYLILNTSGNQETARQVCVEANNALVTELLPHIREGGKIVLMQSVPGHFDPQLRGLGKMPDFYGPIAGAKCEGEQALRSRIPEFQQRGVSFIVVCPPTVSDTWNIKMFDWKSRRAYGVTATENHAEISDMLGIARAVTIEDVGKKVSELLKSKDLPMGYVELFGNVLDARSILSQWYGDNAIFVDTLEMADPKHGTGRMIVAKEYTKGHFNESVGEEVMPGHLMAEAAAQTAGLVFLGGRLNINTIPLLQGYRIDLTKVAKPGDGLKIHAEITEITRRGFVGNILIVSMGDEKVAEITGLKAMVIEEDVARRLLRG